MNTQILHDAFIVFMGILIEATPFVLLGVLISALLKRFLKTETLLKWIPKNRVFSVAMASTLGFFLPVCECGNIPVARRLLSKGAPLSFVVSFLLSAPVFNPIVIISTMVAFPNQPWMLALRVGFTLCIAMSVGLIFSLEKNASSLLSRGALPKQTHGAHSFEKTLIHEFFEMTGVLILGAFIASLFQIILPRELLLNLGQGPLISILAMMFLAILVCICSNVDAFFALSYTNTFTTGSILAFLVLGPMIDLKMWFMLRSILNTKAIVWMSILVISMTTFLTLFVNIFTFL